MRPGTELPVCVDEHGLGTTRLPAKPFERFDDCVLEPDEWTDGDSFRVRLPDGRLETFRLYLVDTNRAAITREAFGRTGGLLWLNESRRDKNRRRSEGFHRCRIAKTVYDSDSLAQSLWTNALLCCRVHRRRKRSVRTAREKWSGSYLWNADAASSVDLKFMF